MIITPQSASTIVDPNQVEKQWCVYEHLMQLSPDAPPSVIYVNTCKLLDVHKLTQARRNTKWVSLTQGSKPIIVRVVATGFDRVVIQREAMRISRAYSPMPICNLEGFMSAGLRRTLYCSNGEQYNTQSEAASKLGITQSAISKHLKGELSHVSGFVFSTVPILVEQVPA